MSYLAIYRRFRPKTFDEMIGQEHIVKTLTNQVQSGRIGHAYLFCGTRGTGKTTAAKIFARAINCEHPINGSPCGECETCKALNDPSNLDILEMDAASNNKVENVREIRDKVQYPPVAGKYKVYIIDEVHMLTTEAFNALLKTLEEPPAHAVFILATTERHKLPATILSRCMRFDFKLVPDKLIVSLIEKIYDEVGKKYDKDAVVKIAQSGEGCVRDALSVADLCLSLSGDKLTYNDVIDVLGASDDEKTIELVDGIFTSSAQKALTVTEQLCLSGKSVGLMCKDVQNVLRNVLIVRTCKNCEEVLALPENALNELKVLAEKTDEHRMLRMLEIFSTAESDLKYSTHQRVVFETAVLKAALPTEDYNIDALLSRIAKLETQLEEIKRTGVKVPISVDYPQKTHENAPQTVKAEVAESSAIKTSDDETAATVAEDIRSNIDSFFSEKVSPAQVAEKPQVQREIIPEKQPEEEVNVVRVWGRVVRKLRADKNIMLWIACQDAEPKKVGDNLVVYVDGDNELNLLSKSENLQILRQAVSAECALNVVITKKGQVVDSFEEDIKKVKEVLDNVEVID